MNKNVKRIGYKNENVPDLKPIVEVLNSPKRSSSEENVPRNVRASTATKRKTNPDYNENNIKATANILNSLKRNNSGENETRNVRATTAAKKKTNPGAIANNRALTSVKRNTKAKLLPTPGQMRIDSFFKSTSKSFMEVSASSTVKISQCVQNRTRPKGRKRLFNETSPRSIPETGKGTAKKQSSQNDTACQTTTFQSAVIDLCSEDEEDIKPLLIALNPLTPVESIETPSNVLILSNVQLNTNNYPSNPENVVNGKRKKSRPCPPYKIIEGTTFAVDGFQFGDIPGVTHYFLTHYHADHYIGLTRKFSHPLYMSPITARLVRAFIPIDEKYIHEIDTDETIVVNNIEVTAIDANHCPGAIMLFYKFSSGECILHTGDFRASFEMESLPIFWNHLNIDILYLDTTYLSAKYDFCHQTESIDRTLELVRAFREKHLDKRILFVCGSYVIGKEKIWSALADEFDLKVWTEPHRRKAVSCLQWPDLEKRLCENEHMANLHVITMGKISYPRLVEYFDPFKPAYDMLLAIRPSGWEKNSKPSYGKLISVIGVEYSEHSSYKELERFVRFLKPKRVISTVPVSRDLFATGRVPKCWHQYSGHGGTLSKGYQPSISSFLKTPQIKSKTMVQRTKGNMLISPFKEIFDKDSSHDNASITSSLMHKNGMVSSKPEAELPEPSNRQSHALDIKILLKEESPEIKRILNSDASDDWLS